MPKARWERIWEPETTINLLRTVKAIWKTNPTPSNTKGVAGNRSEKNSISIFHLTRLQKKRSSPHPLEARMKEWSACRNGQKQPTTAEEEKAKKRLSGRNPLKIDGPRMRPVVCSRPGPVKREGLNRISRPKVWLLGRSENKKEASWRPEIKWNKSRGFGHRNGLYWKTRRT